MKEDEGRAIMNAIDSGRLIIQAPKRQRSTARIFTGLLFAFLLIALLLVILAGTSLYRALDDSRQTVENQRLSLSLIANSVRANDAADAVGSGMGPEGESLVLIDRQDSGTYETRIYLYGGRVVQEYALADAAYTPEKATPLAASSLFEFAYSQGLLSVTTDQGSIDIALRSALGGDA